MLPEESAAPSREGGQQFLVDSTEAAIGKDCDHIAGFGMFLYGCDDRLEVRQIPAVAAKTGGTGQMTIDEIEREDNVK